MSQQINLFNPLFLKQKKYFSAVTMAQALGIIALAVIAFYAYLVIQVGVQQRRSADVQAQFKQAQEQLTQLGGQGARARSKQLDEEIQRLEGQMKVQQQMLGALQGGDLGNAQGFSKFLTALAKRPLPGLWLTYISVGGADLDLVLQGRVQKPELVPTYVRLLNNEEVFRGRKFHELKMAVREESAKAAESSSPRAAAETRPAQEKARYVEFVLVSGSSAQKPGGAP